MLKYLKKDRADIRNGIKSSPIMYIYIHYFLFVWIADLINLACLFIGWDQSFGISHLLAAVCTGVLCLVDNKCWKFEAEKLVWIEYVVLILILILGFYKCIYPDTCFDVATYHGISQLPAWEGRESFYYYEVSFPFADRLFYVFRYFLGYRLGTIANALVLIVIYFQTKRVVKCLLEKCKIKIENSKMNMIVIIGVAAIIMLEGVLMELGTYMTDIVAIPLMLEVLIFIIESSSKENIPFKEMVYVVVCLSFIFLCKFVTAIVIAVYLILYLVVVRKSVTVKRFCGCLFTAIVLVLPLILYNLYFVGEVLFELSFVFNKYSESTMDKRWGGENLFQKILWPIYMAKYPSERHMELIDMPNYYPLFGIIFVIIEFVRRKDKIMTRELKNFSIAIIASFYLWALSGGVDRYAFINLIGFGIVLLYGAITYLQNNKKWISILIGTIIAVQCVGSLWCIIAVNNNWQEAPSVIKQISNNVESYKDQIKYIGQDKGSIVENGEKYEVFIVPGRQYSLWGKMINENAKIFQVYMLEYLSTESQSYFVDELEKSFEEGEVYTACKATSFTECVEDLNSYNLIIKNLEYLNDTYMGDVIVMQVEYEEGEVNQLLGVGTELSNKYASYLGGDKYRFKADVMISPYVTWEDIGIEMNIYYVYEEEKEVIATLNLKQGQCYEIDEEIDMTSIPADERVDIYIDVSYNWGLDWNAIQVINANVY